MNEKREPTEAEALESILRHVRGLASAIETYAKARLGSIKARPSSTIGDRNRDSGTREATPES